MKLSTTEARLSSRCGVCDEKIEPGDEIACIPDGDFVHATCAEDEGFELEASD